MSKADHSIDRRDFLKGATVAGVGAAFVGLTGCTPSSSTQSPTSGASTGTSATDASTSSTRWSWETAPAAIPSSEITEVIDTEIAVVGAGVAGMAIAWWGSKKGAKIHVIEKMEKPSTRSNQIGGLNTQLQKEAGIPDFPMNEILTYLKAFQGSFVNSDLIKQYLYHSGRMFDEIAAAAVEDGQTPALLARGGEGVYVVNTPLYKEYRTMATIYATNEEMVARFQADAEEAGTVFSFSSPAEQLVKEGNKVVGVIAKGPDGYFQVNASKGVVICTGDYSGNEEMMERWGGVAKWSDNLMYTPVGANTGDGLKMMLWAGASMQPCDEHAPMIHCLGGALTCPNPWLRVNALGERYENEDVPNAQVCYGRFMQPGNKAWAIFDDNFRTDCMVQTNGFGRQRWNEETSPATIEDNLAKGLLVQADSLEALAGELGIPADALAETVSRYNELCAAGVDKDYGKDPVNLTPVAKAPFYAAKIVAPILCMVGGINIDSKYRVLSAEGEVIENLYATGNVSGNYYAVDYPSIMAGQSHGRCLTAGMILSEALAEGKLVDPIVA